MNQITFKLTHNPNALLKESIDRFLTDYRNGVTDFSNFSSIFFRLIQSVPDPPLEVLWFYSATTFHTAKFAVEDSSQRVSVAKDLFRLLVSCSASCNAVKKITVLAPVIYELYLLVIDGKNLKGDIENLVEGVVSYISICCVSDNGEGGSEGLDVGFEDLVRVWGVDKIGDNCDFGEEFRVFFPIVSDESRKGIATGCGVGYLAGVVMCEAVLLGLCLKFGLESSRMELEKDMCNWAVQIISGFRSSYFLDTFLTMLLEPNLPVFSLLSSEDEVLLRKVLYDAVVMAEYLFVKHQKGIHLPSNHFKDIAITWLFVADNAIRSARENGNQTKTISYINAFTESHLLSQLIDWVMNQATMEALISRPNLSTPIALLKWLLVVEDKGVKVFNANISKLQAEAAIRNSRAEYVIPVTKPDGRNLDDDLFSSDKEQSEEDKFAGDLEMFDSLETLSFSTATMNTTASDGTRKRKEGLKDEGELQVKFVKYHLHNYQVRKKFLPLGNDDYLSSGSEVDNPVSDEEMEYMEQ